MTLVSAATRCLLCQ